MNRRDFLTKALVAGTVTIPVRAAAGMAAGEALGDSFLRDLGLMLRARIPLRNAIAMLAQKFGSSQDLAPLCVDLVDDLRAHGSGADSASLIAIFEKHAICFTASQMQHIRDGLRSGTLDEVA